MFKFLLPLTLAAVILAQRDNWFDGMKDAGTVVDTIHGYKVQYDDAHDIFIFLSADCYIVEAGSERWDNVVQNHETLYKFSEAVHNQISTNTSVTKMTHQEAIDAYHSRLEQWECRNKDVFKVDFQMPSDN